MSSFSTIEADLSDLAQRALGMSRDRRAHVGDLPLRAGVLGRPSPADLVQLLDAAARGEGAGVCRHQQGAERLLQRLAVTPWLAVPAASSGLAYDVDVGLPQGSVQVAIRRHPAPYVWSVG